jgi:ketosteroid isomerase-like protein
MSQTQNLEVAQSFLAALARDDAPENVASLFTENVEWMVQNRMACSSLA